MNDAASTSASPRLSKKLVVDDDTMIESSQDSDDSSSTMGGSCDDTASLPEGGGGGGGGKRSDHFRFRVRGVKRVMKTLMKRHGGSTRHPRVTKILQKLETLNPTDQPTKSDLLLGEFVAHSSPDFPGRIRPHRAGKGRRGSSGVEEDHEDQIVQYTLGRLSFGIFQPHNLVCTVRAVRNSIQVCADEELQDQCAGRHRRSFCYPIIIDLTIHTPHGDLPAEVRHEALCYETDNEKRLGVIFLGGSLTPAYEVRSNPDLLALWKQTFANAYTIADEQRSYAGRVLRLMMKWWFKMSPPTDEDAEKSHYHSVRYDLKRRPKGHLDVLYLDEDLRVTRGNRGTLIVVERMPYSETPDSSSHPPSLPDQIRLLPTD